MQVVTVVLTMFVVSFLLRSRPGIIALLVVGLWIAVPDAAKELIWGQVSGLVVHPAAALAFVGLAVVTLDDPQRVWRYWMSSLLLHLAATLAVSLIFVQSLVRDTGGTTFIAGQILAPIVTFDLLRLEAQNESFRRTAVNALIVISTLESALAVLQWFVGAAVPYASFFDDTYWFSRYYDRWFGSFDHPLILGAFAAATIFLLPQVRAIGFRFGLAVLFLTCTFIAQARVALVVGVVALIFLIVRSKAGPVQRLILITMTALVPVFAWSAISGTDVYSKFLSDGGSGNARLIALARFLPQVPFHLISGEGPGASYRAFNDLGTSLENPFMMYVIDYGLLAAVLYFGIQLVALIQTPRTATFGLALPSVAYFLMILTFSSIAAWSAAAVILWAFLALASSPRPSACGNGVPVRNMPAARGRSVHEERMQEFAKPLARWGA